MLDLVQTLVGWLSLFVAIGGVALSVPHLARSKWVMVLASAFAVEAVVLGFYRATTFLLSRSVVSAESLSVAFVGASVILVGARAAIVAGVLGLISELPVQAKNPAAEYFGN